MPSRCICRAARLAHPRYSGCSCRAGLRQFARRIQLETVVVKEEELPDRRQCPQRVEWSVAEVQQLQALLLKPPPEQATPDAAGSSQAARTDSDVDWAALASTLGTGRSSAAVRARAGKLGLLPSQQQRDAPAAAAAAVPATAAARESAEDQPAQPPVLVQRSAAEAAWCRWIAKSKPRWRAARLKRRKRRLVSTERLALPFHLRCPA
eukprot:COSAG04_NODE_1442_length_6755_cov_3.734225_9_plen_208_part_00